MLELIGRVGFKQFEGVLRWRGRARVRRAHFFDPQNLKSFRYFFELIKDYDCHSYNKAIHIMNSQIVAELDGVQVAEGARTVSTPVSLGGHV